MCERFSSEGSAVGAGPPIERNGRQPNPTNGFNATPSTAAEKANIDKQPQAVLRLVLGSYETGFYRPHSVWFVADASAGHPVLGFLHYRRGIYRYLFLKKRPFLKALGRFPSEISSIPRHFSELTTLNQGSVGSCWFSRMNEEGRTWKRRFRIGGASRESTHTRTHTQRHRHKKETTSNSACIISYLITTGLPDATFIGGGRTTKAATAAGGAFKSNRITNYRTNKEKKRWPVEHFIRSDPFSLLGRLDTVHFGVFPGSRSAFLFSFLFLARFFLPSFYFLFIVFIFGNWKSSMTPSWLF